MCDGDKALVVKDKTLCTVAKRNMQDIYTLSYDLKKAKADIVTTDSLYSGMARAYTSGNIGPVSNNITKIWNSGEITQEELDVVKWLCFENNAVIDTAKTKWLPTRPRKIDNIIKKYTKSNTPHFFIYSKDKEEWQVEQANDSTMNRISAVIPDSRVKYNKNIGKIDWRMMIKQDVDYTVIEDAAIIKAYNYWLTHQYKVSQDLENVKNDDQWMYKKIREKILQESGRDTDYVVNSLVAYTYSVKQSSNKKMLWGCFGWEIVKNLEFNLVGTGHVCPICGRRFKPRENANKKYCSIECYETANRQKAYAIWEAPKPKLLK